jgi:hypothetical protein
MEPSLVSLVCYGNGSCAEAWVFDGMMSWNDNPYALPEDPQARIAVEADYDRVTAALYMAISRAMTAATNASCRVTMHPAT